MSPLFSRVIKSVYCRILQTGRLVIPALVLLVVSGCSSLKTRTDAEVAYLGYLNNYRLNAPAMVMLRDAWPLERSEKSYRRLIESFSPLALPVRPGSDKLPVSTPEQLAFDWVQTMASDAGRSNTRSGNSRSDGAKTHYALMVWLGYDRSKTLTRRQLDKKALRILGQIKKPDAFSDYLAGVIRLGQRPSSAINSLKKAANKGYAPAQAILARLYLGNDGVIRNDRMARTMLSRLAENSKATTLQRQRASAYLAAMNFYGIGGAVSDRETVRWMARARPEAELLYLQALMAGQGLGMRVDQKRSTELLAQATNAGSTEAANDLALNYLDGIGVKADARRSRALLEQSASMGSAVAAYNLGLDSLYGNSSPASQVAAVLWLERAVARGRLEADRTLAYLTLEELDDDVREGDRGLNINTIRSRLKRAAELGDAWSGYALGLLSLRGQGGAADPLSGYAWLNVAVALGYRPAAELRDASALQMTRPELDRAQALSQTYFDRIEKNLGGA